LISSSGTSTDDEILGALNPAQRSAVERTDGPVLILAGAGSGKTRVLTHRIAWLVRSLEVDPREILAFTFTNKAAGEMKARVAKLVGPSATSMWVGTFHSTCVRILRASGRHLGLLPGFTIYDSDDQEMLVKRAIIDLNLGGKELRPRAVLSAISGAKNSMKTPEAFERSATTYYEEMVARIYAEYQKSLRKANALDFDDLIGETVRLFIEHPGVKEHYSSRFRYVHVDEYQDTNTPQYQLIQHMASAHRNLCVVGDDDQSIYGWRGADIGNILSFETHYPDAFVVRLEQNYRSTSRILAAANAVVKNNTKRKDKTLWTEKAGGDLLKLTIVSDEEEEGQLIVEGLTRAVHREKRSLRDLAVLYRTNAQSRAIENGLRRAAIPYELVGGTPFYQRREVKDLLAYLRLAVNDTDDLAFRRVLNVPKRGLGKTTLDRLSALAFREGIGMTAAARRVHEEIDISTSSRDKVLAFVGLIDELKRRREEPVAEVLAWLAEALEYSRYLLDDDPESASERNENVQELVVGARQFSERAPEPTIEAFLNEVALLTDADRFDESVEKVRLMTAHNAKGLEFDVVFLAGMEEGLMPHMSSVTTPAEVEEERRLFYVALTRAREQVELSAATARRKFGLTGPTGLSRFLNEIPRDLMEVEERSYGYTADYDTPPRPRRPEPPQRKTYNVTPTRPAASGSGSRPASGSGSSRPAAAPQGRRLVLGKIIHPTFGRGEVVGQDGSGPDARLTVVFPGGVVKKIVARYAQWEESDVDFPG
jgi:DNA helicase-2/ATP-dependent DNA helicase PcrA